MEHFYILVTGTDIERDDAPAVHSSSSSRHLPARSPSSSTRSSRGQPAPAGATDERSFFGPPGLSQLLNPPAGAGFGGPSRADSGASAALSSLFSSVAGPGAALGGSGGMPPLVPMSATRIFSSFPLAPPDAHSSAAAGEASSASQSASSTTRPSRAAGTAPSESRGSLGMNPLLEEILQRTFSHVSAETFISEFVRRTIDNQRRGNPPASQFAIDNLQEIPAEGSEECCTVCQDEIEEGTQKLRMPCTHSFHRQCLLRWLAEHNTCPICRCEVESHCARYNQANFDKLKGKLHCKTMSNHEDPSKMEPPPAPDFLFGGAAGAALGAPAAAARTLRMTLRMPAGTLSWLGAEMPPSPARRGGAPAGAQAGSSSSGFGRRAQSRGRRGDGPQESRRPARAAAAAAAEPPAASTAPAGQGAAASSASAEAPPRPPARAGGLPRAGPNWSVLRPFVEALEEAERDMMMLEREREGEGGQAREQRETRPRAAPLPPRTAPLPSPGRSGEGRKRRRGADSEPAGGSGGAAAQEREPEKDDEDESPVAARTRQRQR